MSLKYVSKMQRFCDCAAHLSHLSQRYISATLDNTMGALEQLLPDEWKQNVQVSGNEVALQWSNALAAIRIASENQIAVLGLEVFKLTDSGLLTVNYTGDELERSSFSDWKSYGAATNAEAEKWINLPRNGAGYGYIVTSASELDFEEIEKVRKKPR